MRHRRLVFLIWVAFTFAALTGAVNANDIYAVDPATRTVDVPRARSGGRIMLSFSISLLPGFAQRGGATVFSAPVFRLIVVQ